MSRILEVGVFKVKCLAGVSYRDIAGSGGSGVFLETISSRALMPENSCGLWRALRLGRSKGSHTEDSLTLFPYIVEIPGDGYRLRASPNRGHRQVWFSNQEPKYPNTQVPKYRLIVRAILCRVPASPIWVDCSATSNQATER